MPRQRLQPLTRQNGPCKENEQLIGWAVPVLETPLLGVDPKSKIFFIRLLLVYGSELFAGAIRPLACDLRLSEDVVRHALSKLIAAGVIEKHTEAQASRGRPKVLYQVSSAVTKTLKSVKKKFSTTRLAILGEILDLTILKRSTKPVEIGLSPSARLLFAVLLSLADFSGVVERVSLKKLVQLTGMTRPRLRSQISLLFKKGYLHCFVLDCVGKASPFVNTEGSYFLNLAHPSFVESGFAQQILNPPVRRSFSPAVDLSGFSDTECYYILQLLNIKGMRPADELDDEGENKKRIFSGTSQGVLVEPFVERLLSENSLKSVFFGRSAAYLRFFSMQVDLAARYFPAKNFTIDFPEQIVLPRKIMKKTVDPQVFNIFLACTIMRVSMSAAYSARGRYSQSLGGALCLLPFRHDPASTEHVTLLLSKDVFLLDGNNEPAVTTVTDSRHIEDNLSDLTPE